MLFRSPPWDSVAYWALDLETGGLDARRKQMDFVGVYFVALATALGGSGGGPS